MQTHEHNYTFAITFTKSRFSMIAQNIKYFFRKDELEIMCDTHVIRTKIEFSPWLDASKSLRGATVADEGCHARLEIWIGPPPDST